MRSACRNTRCISLQIAHGFTPDPQGKRQTSRQKKPSANGNWIRIHETNCNAADSTRPANTL